MKQVPENLVNPTSIPAPPNLLRSLSNGFEIISNHLSLVLFPILLDLFLWWGPRLKIDGWLNSVLTEIQLTPELQAADMQDMLRTSRELWIEVSSRINLLTVLRTFPVGISSLMAGISPVKAPLASGPIWQTSGFVAALCGIIGLALLGLGIGTFYYICVSQAVFRKQVAWLEAIRDWPKKYAQVVLLAVFWLAAIAAVSVPFICFLSLLAAGGIGNSQLLILLYASALVWVFIPLAFSAYGIFLNGRTMWRSVVDGYFLTRLTMSSTILFLLIMVFLSQGLNIIWTIPDETSWMNLVGIAGHGFVSTALLAASFVYYRDAIQWVQQTIRKVQPVS
jgi:hypothetical protein